ncbi:poly(3-hydroxyalkanoate) depolymerase [Variovorax sp. GT1P44]|uniref:poly(3-hydroxyalkanoate) depolymerase n=1 Tax=Variovorax sp. GT1P44 TaxID=3443742 RepID=UPI003F445BAA
MAHSKAQDPDTRVASAVERLDEARLDPVTGLHVGTVRIGRQTLRVGIRPGSGGRPLLAFNGIGANLELVGPLLAALDGIETLVFDVPGAGQSPPPKGPYRLFWLARIAARLLDHLGYAQVDVLGVSWGGGLAQQFAIQYPARVGRLILAATSMGGITMVPGRPGVLWKMISPRRYTDRGYMRRVAPDIYGGKLRRSPQAIEHFTRHARGGHPRGYRYQMLAMLGWSSLPWLWRIHHPTLILAGNDDPLVPLVNARMQALLMRHARLHVVDDGHLFLLTGAQQVAPVIQAFLTEGSVRGTSGRSARPAEG